MISNLWTHLAVFAPEVERFLSIIFVFGWWETGRKIMLFQ